MAGRFCDSFEPYNSAQTAKKWTGAGGHTIQGSGRNGNCISLAAGPGAIFKTLDYQAGWTVGFAVQAPTGGFSSQLYVASAINTDHSTAILVTLSLENDGTLTFRAGQVGSGTIIGNSSPTILSRGVWYYVEVQFTLSGATPIVVTGSVKINGNQVINGTGNTASNSSTLVINSAKCNAHGWNAGAIQILLDDLYIVDNTGATNNTFLGDVKIGAVYPNSDVTANWTPSRAGTHFDLINEVPPDDDSTYIKSNTAAQFDNFTFQPITAFTGTIPFVQFSIYARKDDEGTRTFKHTVGPTGALQLLGPQEFLSDVYAYYLIQMDTDPNGNIAWTAVNFNAKDFGVELFS